MTPRTSSTLAERVLAAGGRGDPCWRSSCKAAMPAASDGGMTAAGSYVSTISVVGGHEVGVTDAALGVDEGAGPGIVDSRRRVTTGVPRGRGCVYAGMRFLAGEGVSAFLTGMVASPPPMEIGPTGPWLAPSM